MLDESCRFAAGAAVANIHSGIGKWHLRLTQLTECECSTNKNDEVLQITYPYKLHCRFLDRA